jgi:hypothetical protein
MARRNFVLRTLYTPKGHSSDLSKLVTTAERAEFIRTVLWPEEANRGRPGLFAPSLETQAAGKSKRKSGRKARSDSELEEPDMADSLATD